MEEIREKGIAYCRVSSHEQVQGTSLQMQENMCKDYAEKNNIELTMIYVEEGASAKSAERPEFQKALAYCSAKKNNIQHFIVYKLDRFARNQDDHVTVQALLKRCGTRLRSVTEPIDETPIGRAMEGVLSVFAEFDNNVRAQRSKSGMEEKIKQGVWMWQAPHGYKRLVKGGNLVIDEQHAPYIQLAFDEWSKGTHTYRSLSDFLFNRGFTSKSGKKIYQQGIEKIIRNPIYCGMIHAFNSEITGAFEPIISEALFYKCQPNSVKKVSVVKRGATNDAFPLKNICKCSKCNKSISGSFSTGNGGKYPYYHHANRNCSLTKSHRKDVYENHFVQFLKKISPKDKGFEKLFKAIVMDVWQENYKKLDSDNARIRREIESLESDRQKVFDSHRNNIYNDEEFYNQKNYINAKINKKKSLLQDKQIEELNMEEALTYCFSFVSNSGKTWKDLEKHPEHRLRFQKILFPENIEYDGEKFGTNKISLVYKLEHENGTNSSKLVTLRGIEPRFRP